LDSRSLKCVFLGYKSGTKGYVLYDLHSKSIFVTKNVIFHENIFPYSFSLPSDNSIVSINDSHSSDTSMYDFPALPVSHATNPALSLVFYNNEVIDPDLRTSHRVKNRHQYLDQYYCGVAFTSYSTFSTPNPMHLFVSYDNCSPNHTILCHNISAQIEPFSFKEVAQHDCEADYEC